MKINKFLFFLFVLVLHSFSYPIHAAEKLLFDLPYGWNQVAFKSDSVSEIRKYTPQGKSIDDSVVYLSKTILLNSPDAVLSDQVTISLVQISNQCENLKTEPLAIELQDGYTSQAVFSHCGVADVSGDSAAILAIKGKKQFFLLEYRWHEEPFSDKDLAKLDARKEKLVRSFAWAQVCDDTQGSDSCHIKRKKYLDHLRNESGRMTKVGVVGQAPAVEQW